MGKKEFLDRLERLLSDISQEEREEAMAFYRSYFEEAGEENEASVIAELGSPEKVAEAIKHDLGMMASAEYRQKDEYTGRNQQEHSYKPYSETEQKKTEKKDKWIFALIIIIAILIGPGGLGLILGPIGAMIALTATLIAMTIAMFVVGFVFAGLGITMTTSISMAAGLFFIGAGLLALAIAMLFLLACYMVFGKLYPWLWKLVCSLWKKLCGLWKKFWDKEGAQAV